MLVRLRVLPIVILLVSSTASALQEGNLMSCDALPSDVALNVTTAGVTVANCTVAHSVTLDITDAIVAGAATTVSVVFSNV